MRSFIKLDTTFVGPTGPRVGFGPRSNAIEGVVVGSDRALKIAEGAPRFRNNEKSRAL